jgi:hypothetical protein
MDTRFPLVMSGSACGAGDNTHRNALLDLVGLAASNSRCMEQWYQQLIVDSLSKESGLVLSIHLVRVHKLPCMSDQALMLTCSSEFGVGWR